MIKGYDLKIKELSFSKPAGTDWKKVIKEHKEMLEMIKHERLIHLLVTIFVGTVMSMTFFVTIVSEKFFTLFLGIPLLVLFIAYLFHYRFLENTTQNWYKLLGKIGENL